MDTRYHSNKTSQASLRPTIPRLQLYMGPKTTKVGLSMFFFTLAAVAIMILCVASFMLATAKNPKPMSKRRQKFTRLLLLGLLWTSALSLASHATYTLRSFSDDNHNLLNFRTYPTAPLVYIYSLRDNFNFWETPLMESYYTLPASFSESVRTVYTLSLTLTVVLAIALLFSSFNRCAKVAALLAILVSFASFPFSLIYMLFPYPAPNLFQDPIILWSYFLEQFLSYLVVIVMAGIELRSMKTFSQLKQHPDPTPKTSELTVVSAR